MSEKDKPFSITVRWGEMWPKEERPIDTYEFATADELAAFMLCLNEHDGWVGSDVMEDDGTFPGDEDWKMDEESPEPWETGSPDDFDKKYHGDPDFRSESSDMDGIQETYGDELSAVVVQAQKNRKTVWTIVETGNGLHIIAGLHFVNRYQFFISKEEWKYSNEQYRWEPEELVT